MRSVRAAASLAALLYGLPFGVAQNPATNLPDVRTIASAVRAQEDLLLNLRVSAHHDWERWDSETGLWAYAGEADVQAWLTGEPGKVRLDYERRITPWVDGLGPFAEGSSRIAFNGQASKRLETRVGVADSASSVLTGELTAGVPPDVANNAGFQAGWQFSALGASPNWDDGVRFSDYLVLAEAHAPRVDVLAEEAGGNECVAVRVEEPNGQQRIFIFDPVRAYALVGAEFRLSSGVTAERWTAQELLALAPGFYLPVQAVRELFAPDGCPRERFSYYASEVVANDPAWTDDVFDPPWPPGTVVNDRITGTLYQIAPSAQQLETAVDQQIGDLLAGMRPQVAARRRTAELVVNTSAGGPGAELPAARPPAPKPATSKPALTPKIQSLIEQPAVESQPASRPERDIGVCRGEDRENRGPRVIAPPPADEPMPRGSRAPELVVLVLGIGALVVVAIVLGKGKRAGPLVLLICLGASPSGGGDERMLALTLPLLGQQKLSSCGLNAALFVGRYFALPVTVDSLAAELRIGVCHQRPCSLLDLKEAFLARGLSVEGYRDATISEIGAKLDGSDLWVLHIDRSEESRGHFFVLAGQGPDQVCWIEPASAARWVTAQQLEAQLAHQFTGWCLRIGPPGSNPPQERDDGAAIAWFPEQINLGILRPEQASRTAVTITFVMRARVVVRPAECSSGLELARECCERELGPGTAFWETRTYTFRLRQLPVGDLSQTVTLRTTMPGRETIVIPVRGKIRELPG